jgi:hypothetical protein
MKKKIILPSIPSPDEYIAATTQILDSLKELLDANYLAAARLPDDKGRIKLGFAITIDDRDIETICTYGQRFKVKTERVLEDPAQTTINFSAGRGTD